MATKVRSLVAFLVMQDRTIYLISLACCEQLKCYNYSKHTKRQNQGALMTQNHRSKTMDGWVAEEM